MASWVPTVIVDTSPLLRAGLMHILAGSRFRVMVSCSSIKDIRKSALNGRVCLALIGLDKDARAVLSKVSVLKAQHECLRVVIFSDRFDLEELLTVIASGGDCYLLKNEISPDTLLKSLELVFLGETIVPQGFTQLLRSQVRLQQEDLSQSNYETLSQGNYIETSLEHAHPRFPPVAPRTDDIVRLSNREQMILLYLTQGASNKHIARELEISEATVKTHVKALLHKIRVRNRTQAAMWATKHLGPSRLDDAKSVKLDLTEQLAISSHAEQKVSVVQNPRRPVCAWRSVNGDGRSL
jgi:two-component system, NarL family, nitrate/nitrite response regulator NarL